MSRRQAEVLAKNYQLDGVMIGRGVFHDPFVFAAKSPWADWSKAQKLDLFKRHIKLFAKTWPDGEYKFNCLKKFAKVYINGFPGATHLRAQFMKAAAPGEALDILS